MFRQIKSVVLIAITVGVVMSWAVPAMGGTSRPRAFDHGERYINQSGGTAGCLRKILWKWQLRDDTVKSDQFAMCTVDRVATSSGEYQIIECRDGAVENGQEDEVTFSGFARDGTAEVVCAKWYSTYDGENCTGFLDYATLVASNRPQEADVRAPNDVRVEVVVTHHASEWDDEANDRIKTAQTVAGSEIYYARWQGFLHADDMTEVLWTCVDINSNPPPPGSRIKCLNDEKCKEYPDEYEYCGRFDPGKEPVPGGIDWYQPTGPKSFVLLPGPWEGPEDPAQAITFDLGYFRKSDRVLFRFYTDLKGNYEQSDYEVIQFWVREIIPTVSEWGLVVIALLMLAAGTIVIRRRRAVAARA